MKRALHATFTALAVIGLAILAAAAFGADQIEMGVLTASPGCGHPAFAAGPANEAPRMRLLCDVGAPAIPNCPSPPGAGNPPCEPPPQPGVINCGSSFSATKVIDARFDVGAGYRYFTDKPGTFTPPSTPVGYYADTAIVVRFTAPAAGDPGMLLEAYETGTATGRPTKRVYTLSTLACDVAIPKSSSALYANDQNQALSLSLRTDGNCSFGEYCLVPGKTYYVNSVNRSAGVSTCAVRCDNFYSFNNPR